MAQFPAVYSRTRFVLMQKVVRSEAEQPFAL